MNKNNTSGHTSHFPSGRAGDGLHILVTGGTGYIGSHTVVELLNGGYHVSIIDNLSNSRIEVLESIYKITGNRPSFVEIDLCDSDALKKFFDETEVDATIHFAD